MQKLDNKYVIPFLLIFSIVQEFFFFKIQILCSKIYFVNDYSINQELQF